MNFLKYLLLALVILGMISGCRPESQTKSKTAVFTPHYISSNGIEISHPWARPASKGGNSAAYLHIYNGSNTTDTLISIDSDIAQAAEVHESFEKNGLTGMRPADRIIILPDSSFLLSPGGFHIMLMKLEQQLTAGDSLNLELNFTNAGPRKLALPIENSDE